MLRTSREGRARFQAAALSQEGNLEVSGALVTAGMGRGSCHARHSQQWGVSLLLPPWECRWAAGDGQEGKWTTASMACWSASLFVQVCQVGD